MEKIEKMKKYFLMMLVVLMGGVVSSCGDDDDDDDNGGYSGDTVSTWTIKMRVSDQGTLENDFYELLNASFAEFGQELPNVSLDLAKKVVDETVAELQKEDEIGMAGYDYTMEIYVADASGKAVYSRYLIIKNGKIAEVK